MGKRRTESRARGGYSYSLTDDQLRAWMATPARVKLRWLAEAAEFVWKASSPEIRELRERLRRGEI